jgi:hypothetical protein
MTRLSRLLAVVLVLSMPACSAIKKADKRIQSWTDEMLRGRDPDQPKPATAATTKPIAKPGPKAPDAGVETPPGGASPAP